MIFYIVIGVLCLFIIFRKPKFRNTYKTISSESRKQRDLIN